MTDTKSPKTKLELVSKLSMTPASPHTQGQSMRPNLKDLVSRPSAQALEPAPVQSVPEDAGEMAPVADALQSGSAPERVEQPPSPVTASQKKPPAARRVVAASMTAGQREAITRLPITYAFAKSNFEAAEKLAAVIGVRVSDIIQRISKEFDETKLDFTIKEIEPRAGASHIVAFKVSMATVLEARAALDPLGIRADGRLLRIPIIAHLDDIANAVLKELKDQFNV